MLLVHPESRPSDSSFAGGVRSRGTNAKANSALPHEVRHVPLRGSPNLEAGEMAVLSRRHDLAAARRGDSDAAPPCRFVHTRHSSGAKAAAPVTRQDFVPLD